LKIGGPFEKARLNFTLVGVGALTGVIPAVITLGALRNIRE
jgi:hypothetical protein